MLTTETIGATVHVTADDNDGSSVTVAVFIREDGAVVVDIDEPVHAGLPVVVFRDDRKIHDETE